MTATAATTTSSSGCYPPISSRATSHSRSQFRHRLLSRYRAHGLLAVGGADIFGGLGPAKPDPRFPGYRGRTALREDLIADGAIVPVDVEGVRGKRFVLADEVGLLENPPEPPPSVAFLSPFDALVWDRPLLGSLFGFDYVWELFIPPEKRRWGWYVLPMLFRDRLVGRIEPRIDRERGRVEVLDLWWEDGFAPRRADGLRRLDAGGAPRLPALRGCDAPRVGAAPRDGEAAVPHAPVGLAWAHGRPSQRSGGPGCHRGNVAYASRGTLVSVSTPAPWRRASSERG